MNNPDRLPIWPFLACPLLAGALLALAWWDWVYQGQILLWWQEKPIYPLLQHRLAWTLFFFECAALLLWWLSLRADPERRMPRASAPFLSALLALPFFLRYGIHPLGVQPGSSAWAYFLISINAVVVAIPLAGMLDALLKRLNRARPLKEGVEKKHLKRRGAEDQKHRESQNILNCSLLRPKPLPPASLSSFSAHSKAILGALVLIYVLVFGALSIADHLSFRTHALDTGTMDQAAWNTIHGRILERTPLYRAPAEGSRYENRLLDAKLELIFIPLSALYWLLANPCVLLIVQTLCLAAGAIPLYGLVHDLTSRSLWGVLIAAAYLLYLPLHYVNMAEFHSSALMVPMFIAAWRAMRARRWAAYYLWIGLALTCRIEAAFVLIALGPTMWLWSGRRTVQTRPSRNWLHGLVTVLIGLAWLGLDLLVVVPWMQSLYGPGAGNLIERRFGALGDTPLEAVKNLLANPGLVLTQFTDREKLQAIFDLVAPLGFASLLALPALLPALPVLVINLLAGSEWQMTIYAHYMAPVIPFIWIAAAEAVAWLSRPGRCRSERVGAVLALTILLNTFGVGFWFSPYPPGKTFHVANYYQKSVYDDNIREILALVPPDASVCAQSDLHPHLSQRRDALLFYRCELSADELAEYVALDLDASANKSPLDFHTFYELVDLWLERPEYGVIAQRGGVLLLRLGAARDNIAQVRRALAEYGKTIYQVRYLSAATPLTMQTRQLYQIKVRVRNVGLQVWEAGPWLPVRLSYRWWTENGARLVSESLRTNVPHRVEPGSEATFAAWVIAPPGPGRYVLEWDMLREGDAWFSEHGGETLRQTVIVQ